MQTFLIVTSLLLTIILTVLIHKQAVKKEVKEKVVVKPAPLRDQDEDYFRISNSIDFAENLTHIDNIYKAINSFRERHKYDQYCKIQTGALMNKNQKKALKISPINFNNYYDNQR